MADNDNNENDNKKKAENHPAGIGEYRNFGPSFFDIITGLTDFFDSDNTKSQPTHGSTIKPPPNLINPQNPNTSKPKPKSELSNPNPKSESSKPNPSSSGINQNPSNPGNGGITINVQGASINNSGNSSATGGQGGSGGYVSGSGNSNLNLPNPESNPYLRLDLDKIKEIITNAVNKNSEDVKNELKEYIKGLTKQDKEALEKYSTALKISNYLKNYLNSGKTKILLSNNEQYNEKNKEYEKNVRRISDSIYKKNEAIIEALNNLNKDYKKWLEKEEKEDNKENFMNYMKTKAKETGNPEETLENYIPKLNE